MKKTASLTLSTIVMASLFCGPVFSAAPQENAPKPTLADLGVMENRFFSHPFLGDPVEKRLERLECLVFGGTQPGTNEERMARLMKSVASRSQTPVPVDPPAAGEKPATKTSGTTESANKNSQQYAALNTLEWRALKKTYPQDSLDARLNRLESKLFGQPADGMAYIDRFDRLKKVVGIGVKTTLDEPIASQGPMPKARPRGESSPFFSESPQVPGAFGRSFDLDDEQTPRQFGFRPGVMPPGFGSIFGTTTFDQQMKDMMERMNRQMADAERLGPGAWTLDPSTGTWIEMNTGRKVPQAHGPQSQAPGMRLSPSPGQVKPQDQKRMEFKQPRSYPFVREVPPYMDPNSI